jgi:hypothetical protein
MRRPVILLLLLCLVALSGPGCIWKLWSKEAPPEDQEFDLYGNVVSVNAQEIVVESRGGNRTFLLDQASVKGGDFQPGARVHVFYKLKEAGETVVLVVEVRK